MVAQLAALRAVRKVVQRAVRMVDPSAPRLVAQTVAPRVARKA